ncbi:MAG: MiaB/RimO family radical SAM methylthiotransferase [Acidobacteria bacterium]|nr:MiaB/RimO family radical SAM methylthiotransferase [Acidobacteriota bacterium]
MVSIFTQGCRLNQYDSAYLKAILEERNEDIIVLNTCAVTSKAHSEARKILRKLRRENQDKRIAAIGCSIKYSNDRKKEFKEADIIAENKEDLLKKLDILNTRNVVPDFGERTRAFLKIQEGCDRKCSYCVVPFVKGGSKSRNLCEIEKEFDSFIKNNYKEIVITGTNISDYGKDLDGDFYLTDVLKTLIKKNGDFRIRLSSVEFSAIDDEFVKIIKENQEKICNHIHIPIQSCSPKVLKSMNRNQDINSLKKVLEKLALNIPGLAIGCDILCAFPTEDDQDFKETVDFIENSPISFFHIFTFSRREHTSAQFLKPLPEKIVDERKKILFDVAKRKNFSFLKKNEGKVLRALTLNNGYALSSNFIEFKTLIKGRPNEFKNFTIKIDKFGEPVGKEV